MKIWEALAKVFQKQTCTLDTMEKAAIMAMLRITMYNKTQAAKHLGIAIRTMRMKIRKYEIEKYKDEIYPLKKNCKKRK